MARSSGPAPRPTVRASETKLSRHLHGAVELKAGPLEAFKLARRAFLAGEQIDMGAISKALDVDRATLFRWLGNRDQLITEVIWSFAEPAWRRALDAASGTGSARVAEVLARWIEDIAGAEFFRAYLRREPARALRLLTTSDGLHQQRVLDIIEELLCSEPDLTFPLPVRDFAYVITRIAESFLYSDLITGATPDASKASITIGTLLGVEKP
ncbi:QsdR family transcriptional regulator [Amycolatopsis jiangsuensis]|uniref:AcrR family transcriptional regulator n=1 Tax=Amycolatopsis jiangsuensis TaxID=1181879 RepID=A0A840J0U2_9PSEU|nr:QsdR family transcriptional regulator [Amycolatopsis jiangsuensis]MBB4687553.1 AcrR family transcriptional regulator [Amycolatopsis jiangsuensis]